MTPPDAVLGASVLLSFRAANVRSFREQFEFSMLGTRVSEQSVVRQVAWKRTGSPLSVLPAAGIFGANASGKSNLLRAMDDMRAHVLHSFRSGSPTGGVPRRPFMLDPGSRNAPSVFEVDLVLRGVRHNYGFSVNGEEFLEEWATAYPEGRPVRLFHREGEHVDLCRRDRTTGRAVASLLRPNALYLSTAASANHKGLLPLFSWFERNLLLAEANDRHLRQALTADFLDDPNRRVQVLDLLRSADLGITGASRRDLDPTTRDKLVKVVRILAGEEPEMEASESLVALDQLVALVHRGAEGEIELDPSEESLGTMVWFGLVGPVVQALNLGCVLLADELDASLHPALTMRLIQLFQDPETNPLKAQLIFNSHDATLLGDSTGDRLLGRDQIWFTEKRSDGSTRLYPLSDLAPRRQEAVASRYLQGRYGAVPLLSQLQFRFPGQQLTLDAEHVPSD